MNRLSIEKRVQVISALVEGNSLRSTVRMTGVALNTIQKLLAELGTAGIRHRDLRPCNILCRSLDPLEVSITGFSSSLLSQFASFPTLSWRPLSPLARNFWVGLSPVRSWLYRSRLSIIGHLMSKHAAGIGSPRAVRSAFRVGFSRPWVFGCISTSSTPTR